MKADIILTADGSHSIYIPEMDVFYHSKHGAIQESMHVFISAGLKYIQEQWPDGTPLHIFEVGFGTGLNALLTLIEAENKKQKIFYETSEAFPIETTKIRLLNYCTQLNRQDLISVFETMHFSEWEKKIDITDYFVLIKTRIPLQEFSTQQPIHLIYFDAFAPKAQPELWKPEIFSSLYYMMAPQAVLVTYCSKGDVRRALLIAGFIVEKIPGAPGKREMLRAIKPIGLKSY